jgi:hypothetical protein
MLSSGKIFGLSENFFRFVGKVLPLPPPPPHPQKTKKNKNHMGPTAPLTTGSNVSFIDLLNNETFIEFGFRKI